MNFFPKIIAVSYFCALHLPLFAQSAEDLQLAQQQMLLQNPDIVWMEENPASFILDGHQSPRNRSTNFANIKLVANPNQLFSKMEASDYGNMGEQILSSDFFAKNKVFDDETFKNATSEKQIIQMLEDDEPHEWFDPTAPNVPEPKTTLNPKHTVCYGLKNWVYFDQKTNAFGLKVQALHVIYDHPHASVHPKYLFFMPVKESPKPLDLKDPNITLAKRCTWKVSFEIPKKENIKKQEKSLAECISSHLLNIRKEAKTVDIRDNMGILQKMPASLIAQLGADKTEKVQVTDPETMVSSVQTITSKFDPESLTGLIFMQEWYWDESRQELSYHTLFYAPLFSRPEVDGDFIWFWKAAAP